MKLIIINIAIPIVISEIIVPVIVFIIVLKIPFSPNSFIIATCKINSDIIDVTKLIDLEAATIGEYFLKLFRHIKENQLFYRIYFKLDFDFTWNKDYLNDEMLLWYGSTKNKDYHITFFKAGLNAVIKMWLDNGCIESSEEIEEIIKKKYSKDLK